MAVSVEGGLAGPNWPEFELSDDEAPPEEHHWLDNPPTVGAVVVAHNGARWLPKVLGSFSSMFYAPTAWPLRFDPGDALEEIARNEAGVIYRVRFRARNSGG